MQATCSSCGTEVETEESRWCPNPDCGAYISWEQEDESAAEASTTRRPGEQDPPPPPPTTDATTVMPPVTPTVDCPSCGTENPESRSLCQRCGTPLHQQPTPPPPSPPVATRSGPHPGVLVGIGLGVVLLVVAGFVLFGGGDDVPVGGATPVAGEQDTGDTGDGDDAAGDDATPTDGEDGEDREDSDGDGETGSDPAGPDTPAWVAVLRSMDTGANSQGDAEASAADLAGQVGGSTAVLRSDDFSSLNAGYWVVYVDGFADQDAADAFCDGIADVVPDCYARLVEE